MNIPILALLGCTGASLDAANTSEMSQASDTSQQGGACVEGVCELPEPWCEGQLAMKPVTATCVAGTCEVESDEEDCASSGRTCIDGRCRSGCVGVCVQPLPHCDGEVAVRYTGSGTCDPATVTCNYDDVSERTDCAAMGATCIDGACEGACCTPGTVAEAPVLPNAVYLRTSEESNIRDATIVDLREHNFCPGDTVVVSAVGTYLFSANDPASTTDFIGGVFSGSDVLLAPEEAHRVPDAIDAGADMQSSPTLNGDLPTDIPEDFHIQDNEMVIPVGATHLFVGVVDRYSSDNGATDEGLVVRMECLSGA